MTSTPVRILVVDDEPAHCEAILRSLADARMGYQVSSVGSLREYRERLVVDPPDLAILDLLLPDGRAESVLVHPPDRGAFAQVVMTSHGDEQVAVAALQAGALDYVVKSSEAFAQMPRTVERALQAWTLLIERRRALADLRESEERLRLATESAQIGTWEYDVAGGRMRWSAIEEQLMGYEPGEFPGTFAEFERRLHPDSRPVLDSAMAQAGLGNGAFSTELRFVLRDGRERWGLIRGRAHHAPDGRLVGIVGIDLDVTQKKRSEWFLSLTAEVLAILNESAPLKETVDQLLASILRATGLDAVGIRLREGGQYPFVGAIGFSEEVLRMSHQQSAERAGERVCAVGGRTLCERVLIGATDPRESGFTAGGSFCADDFWSRINERMEGSQTAGGGRACLCRQLRSVALIPIRTGGAIVGLLQLNARSAGKLNPEMVRFFEGLVASFGVALQRRQIHEALVESDQRLRAQARLLDLAEDAIVVRDMEGRVRFWNEGSFRLTGWTAEDARERRLEDLLVASGTPWATAERELAQRGFWSGELQFECKDGRSVVVMSRWTLVRDDQGQPDSVLLISTDVTERKKLEAQFLRAQRLESIGSLASGIAHDLNNILSPILMSAPLLRETVSDAESCSMIDTMELCAKRGSDITRQLLTFARGTPGARVSIPLRPLLREMEQILRETFPKDIRPVVVISGELESVQGDATQVHQALMNLCLNARDAMPDGGVLELLARNVAVDEAFAGKFADARPGTYVCLSVVDSGAGISPANLDRIFDPFYTTKEVGKGTGLGLASVLGIVRGHGGFIRVTSELGRGTTCDLFFPAAANATAKQTAAPREAPSRGAGELILVVDDEASILSTIHKALEAWGYRVLLASQGAEALEFFAQHRGAIRAVITDMMMPVMNGPAMVRALRQLDPALPIIGMTGLPERAALKDLDRVALPFLLTKPFTGEELVHTLQSALQRPPSTSE